MWLGVPAVDGARVGPLSLSVDTTQAGVTGCRVYIGEHTCFAVVDWCQLSEVDQRTRAWLSSLAALLGPAELPAEVLALLESADFVISKLRSEAIDPRGVYAGQLLKDYDVVKQKAGR